MLETGRKTDRGHWDGAWSLPVRQRLPSRLNVDVLNYTRLLRRHVKPGSNYLELGCAPGKMLAWVAAELGAKTSGLDYSDTGVRNCHALFRALGLDIKVHHEDIFNHTLEPGSFDVVASFGLIEHFDDPRPVVQAHVDLVAPGGVALIGVPNYSGIYERLQRWCDAPNLALHNLEIMNVPALSRLAENGNGTSVQAYPSGSVSPWIVNLDKKMPRALARLLSLGVNTLGLLQPVTIAALAPMLVLEVRKRAA